MELANGEHNKFFSKEYDNDNRYYIDEFNAEATKGTNNVCMLVENIAENSTVLDLGCAQGNFGNELKRKNCRIFGVDLNEEAINETNLTGSYEKTFLVDITDTKSKQYIEMANYVKDVDAIIISDVFEHVSDPTRLLVEASKFLRNNGVILVSVPNIAHIDILLHLMNDKFNYQDMGILDNTHLKFFTKTSFIDWISQINEEIDDIKFDCEYLGATFYNNEYLKYIKENYNELFNILENSENYNALQILFKITKISKEDKAIKLEEMLKYDSTNVVEILGKALEGKCDYVQNHKIVEGERLWYEQQLERLQRGVDWHNKNKNEMEKYIQELQKGIDWHNKNKKEMEKYIQELQRGIDWHNKNKKEMEKYIEQREEAFENLRKKDKEELLKLRQRLFDIENSRLWKLTKIFRKS